MRTYIHTDTYARTYVRTYIHIHTHTYTCMHACINTYIHTYTHTCMYACMHACMHAHTHAYTHTLTHTTNHTTTHTYIYIYIYIYMHTSLEQGRGRSRCVLKKRKGKRSYREREWQNIPHPRRQSNGFGTYRLSRSPHAALACKTKASERPPGFKCYHCIDIYIYIEREREREIISYHIISYQITCIYITGAGGISTGLNACLSMCSLICKVVDRFGVMFGMELVCKAGLASRVGFVLPLVWSSWSGLGLVTCQHTKKNTKPNTSDH